MPKKNNDKQQKILDFLRKEVEEKGYPPSVREICSAIGLKSTSTVHSYLAKLEKEGFIQKDPSKPRAIKVVDNQESNHKSDLLQQNYGFLGKKIIQVPIVGKVTAGQPILAVENIEDTFPLPAEFVRNSTTFMLKVKGESMIEAGILDGDMVLVRQQSSAQNGDIVVALIGDEATIKTFYKEKDYIRLQPENRYMEPIIVKDNVSILGKVIGVFRKL
ncbi:MAG TPA: transcriptional repressor LexA [Clostridiaceae bacterium]|nr:transcriptional repressor LexA [Clostridiaceae bacterium]